ncbi:MAG: NAD(P)/FAD-dependent oxidoreductase [Acidobacteriota bacterium]
MGNSGNQFDVAILGAGIGGAMLGTILARRGARVLILDAGTHPRYALGESTVRHTLRMVRIMAERFDVPELAMMGSGRDIRKYVSSNCGEKRNFGFVFHREGQLQKSEEATQLVIPPFREGYEAHLFRQDIDAFLYQAAVHNGALGRLACRVQEIDFDDTRVTLKASTGETFSADYLVDASGFRSPLAQKFDLREKPTRAKTHSRALFTHMIDVKPFDECVDQPHGTPEPWHSGTCHHIFDGGWVWVIPFNNQPDSKNPLLSIGLQLDSRRHPKPDNMTPEEEWQHFLSRFPSIARQFENAKIVRPWVSTGRIQYTSKQTVGDRWCLLAHAAGNIDALFSRGLGNTMESMNALAALLLAAIEDRDFSAKRFDYLERLQQKVITNNDLLIYGAYVAFRDFDLWNAWFRVWALGVGLGDLRLAGIYRRYLRDHDDSILPDAQEPMGLFYSNHRGFQRLFQKALEEIGAVEEGTLDPKEGARRIMDLIKGADYTAPAIGLADESRRYINAGALGTALRSALWVMTSAPPEIKQHLAGALGGFFSKSGKDRRDTATVAEGR